MLFVAFTEKGKGMRRRQRTVIRGRPMRSRRQSAHVLFLPRAWRLALSFMLLVQSYGKCAHMAPMLDDAEVGTCSIPRVSQRSRRQRNAPSCLPRSGRAWRRGHHVGHTTREVACGDLHGAHKALNVVCEHGAVPKTVCTTRRDVERCPRVLQQQRPHSDRPWAPTTPAGGAERSAHAACAPAHTPRPTLAHTSRPPGPGKSMHGSRQMRRPTIPPHQRSSHRQ